MKNKIIGIGEVVWDCLPEGRKLGGAPLNFAYFALQCGAESYAVSAVGNDDLGRETLDAIRKSGVDVSYIQVNDLPTSRVLVTVDGEGVPQYEILQGVAWDALGCNSTELELVKDASAVCWGSLAQRSALSRESILAMVGAAPESCIKVFDINIRQHYYDRETLEGSLRLADVLKLNEDELPLVRSLFGIGGGSAEEQIAELVQRFALKYVVYTCGSAFSEVYGREGLLSRIDTPEVEVADTVGAGDSFTAVLVASLLGGKDVAEAHALAVDVAAFVCTKAGAINPLPEDLRVRL
ncbi:MAG: carbohydrate kinase [Bacteroidales bacterium]|nr:carbohydrate kinase [Bacteroidales bacterium]